MISFLLTALGVTRDLILTFAGVAAGIGAAWLAFQVGVRPMAAIIMGAAIGLLPATYIKGRNDERKSANVQALRDTVTALEQARDASARLVAEQSKATVDERAIRIEAERKLAESEERARATDEKLEQVSTFTCPPAAARPGTPTPPVVFRCPSPGLSSSELDELRRDYPPGQIRRARRPAPSR